MRKQRRRRESLGEYSKEKKQEGKELLEKRKVQQFVTRMTWRQRKNEQERLKGQEMKEGMKDGRRSIIQAKVTTVPVFSWVCRHCPVSFPFLWLFCEKEERHFTLSLWPPCFVQREVPLLSDVHVRVSLLLLACLLHAQERQSGHETIISSASLHLCLNSAEEPKNKRRNNCWLKVPTQEETRESS